jgi:uncharacterized damage-inducible protein DinB
LTIPPGCPPTNLKGIESLIELLVVILLDYKEMCDYYKSQRARLIQVLEKMSNEEFVKTRDLSFPSIKDVLAHTVMVEDNYLHYTAAGVSTGTSVKLDDFKNLQDIKNYMAEVDSKTEKLFAGMTEQGLRKEVTRTGRDGKVNVYSVEQILYNVPIEVISHYGEIFGELWKMDINPSFYSYLAFVGDRKKI